MFSIPRRAGLLSINGAEPGAISAAAPRRGERAAPGARSGTFKVSLSDPDLIDTPKEGAPGRWHEYPASQLRPVRVAFDPLQIRFEPEQVAIHRGGISSSMACSPATEFEEPWLDGASPAVHLPRPWSAAIIRSWLGDGSKWERISANGPSYWMLPSGGDPTQPVRLQDASAMKL